MGIAHPRLAVAGLNPHSGEGGLFGREEIEQIQPAIDAARAEGLAVYPAPLPGDTVFLRMQRGKEFDAVVAQYHDQGHIAAKLVDFFGGVNITLGLPIIRTSVDHGTAFDIAGKGIANPNSLLAAIEYARLMAAHRPNAGRIPHAQRTFGIKFYICEVADPPDVLKTILNQRPPQACFRSAIRDLAPSTRPPRVVLIAGVCWESPQPKISRFF